jgi:hypothetical protein
MLLWRGTVIAQASSAGLHLLALLKVSKLVLLRKQVQWQPNKDASSQVKHHRPRVIQKGAMMAVIDPDCTSNLTQRHRLTAAAH